MTKSDGELCSAITLSPVIDSGEGCQCCIHSTSHLLLGIFKRDKKKKDKEKGNTCSMLAAGFEPESALLLLRVKRALPLS